MSVSAAENVRGWATRGELTWLHDRAAGRRLVVEFGSWCGRSAVAMSSAAMVLCVDTWAGSVEHREEIAQGLDPWVEWCKSTSDVPNVTPFACDLSCRSDVDRMASFVSSRGGADMVFVDAAHDYESVVRDIETARLILSPGGLLCGHDYTGDWPGVVQAVGQCIPAFDTHETIWFSA